MISQAEIIAAYQAAFSMKWWERLLAILRGTWLADLFYSPANLEAIQRVIHSDQIQLMQYVAEAFDCDDFAFALMGAFHHDRETAAMPIFVTWVNTPLGGHAICSFYMDNKVHLVEPQNDRIFPVPSDWKLLLLCG